MSNVKYDLDPDFLYYESSTDGDGNYQLDYINLKPSLFITLKTQKQIIINKHTYDDGSVYVSMGSFNIDPETGVVYVLANANISGDPETDTWTMEG